METANHPKTIAETILTIAMMMNGSAFFTVNPLNFSANIGKVETIKYEVIKIRAYHSHLFKSNFKIQTSCAYQYNIGKAAKNNPTAGIGTPLKPNC